MKKILILAAVLGLIGGAYGLYMYNKPAESAANKKVDVTVEAAALVSAYKADESTANTTYLNKVVLASGTVAAVTSEGDLQVIRLSSGDPLSSVMCEMSEPMASVKPGDEITIKGLCAGYLLDVVLTKCVAQ